MIENLLENLGDMVANDAIDILITEFEQGSDTICFQGTGRIVSLNNLQIEYHQIPGVLAKYVSPIKFVGGPATNISTYQGSLLTLLCDRILRQWSRTGSYADLVEQCVL